MKVIRKTGKRKIRRCVGGYNHRRYISPEEVTARADVAFREMDAAENRGESYDLAAIRQTVNKERGSR